MALVLKSILSEMSAATLTFLSFPFTWNISFYHCLTFILNVSFALRWVSCRQYIVGSCVFLQATTLCLSTGAFSPFTYKVIIDKYVFIAILNFVFQLILCFYFIPFVCVCLCVCVCVVFLSFRATPMAYRSSQARGRIRTVATSLCQGHNNAGSEPHLWPTSQHMAMLDP